MFSLNVCCCCLGFIFLRTSEQIDRECHQNDVFCVQLDVNLQLSQSTRKYATLDVTCRRLSENLTGQSACGCEGLGCTLVCYDLNIDGAIILI